MTHVKTNAGELYYLRLLLLHEPDFRAKPDVRIGAAQTSLVIQVRTTQMSTLAHFNKVQWDSQAVLSGVRPLLIPPGNSLGSAPS